MLVMMPDTFSDARYERAHHRPGREGGQEEDPGGLLLHQQTQPPVLCLQERPDASITCQYCPVCEFYL